MLPFDEAWTGSLIHKRQDTLKPQKTAIDFPSSRSIRAGSTCKVMVSRKLLSRNQKMILFKTIALQYGRYMATGQPGNKHDLVGRKGPVEETLKQRADMLRDLAAAQIYLLDHRAANYLDSLRMDVQGKPSENPPESHIREYVSEVEFPQGLIWVEYDSRKLWEDRIARGLTLMNNEQLSNWHQRGFLFDNRSRDTMTVRLFVAMTDDSFLDSPITLVLKKSQDGRADFNGATWQPQMNVVAAHLQLGSGRQESDVLEFLNEYKGHLSYEMVIGFMLLAALASREDDLLSNEVQSLSTAQAKTARKFGKTWMTETLRSHVMVRIGPAGERHLLEREKRRQFEEAKGSGRATPTEHWVSEHERRYASGRVVKIRAHKRGLPADLGLPVRVVGPRLEN